MTRAALVLVGILCCGGATAAEGDAEREFRTVSARFVETLDATEAQAGYLRLTRTHPGFAPPYYNLARLAESARRWEEALAWYRAYLERAPTGTWSALASDRLSELERLAAAGPEERQRRDYDAALGRAKAAIDAGAWGAALADLEQAAELDPRPGRRRP